MLKDKATSHGVLQYDQNPQTATASGFQTCLLTLLVFVFHCIVQFVLYHGRFHGWIFCESDLIAFALPNALSLSAYAILMVRWIAPKHHHPALKIIWMIIFSLILQFFSWCGSMLIPVNIYGT